MNWPTSARCSAHRLLAPRQPSFGVSLLIILLPVILMLGST